MIDFHNHIIPNLDDGSKSIEMSLNMVKEAETQGITDIVNTVHYQHPKMEKKDTSYKFIKNEINKFQKIVYDNNLKFTLSVQDRIWDVSFVLLIGSLFIIHVINNLFYIIISINILTDDIC